MTILITGGTGFIGSHLSRRLVNEGNDVVIFSRGKREYKGIADIRNRVDIVVGDVAKWWNVFHTIKAYDINVIFHLARSGRTPMESLGPSFLGTVNILEAARILDIEKVIYASSIGVYAYGLSQPVMEDVPTWGEGTYGKSKVFSELMGIDYYDLYGIDFRAARLPQIIGPWKDAGGPGAYTTWAPIKAALGEKYEVPCSRETRFCTMYVKDAVEAFIKLYKPASSSFRVYNFDGISPTAGEFVDEIKRQIPEAGIKFAPKPEIISSLKKWYIFFDDSRAKENLGWNLSYNLEKLIEDFIKEIRTKTSLYV